MIKTIQQITNLLSIIWFHSCIIFKERIYATIYVLFSAKRKIERKKLIVSPKKDLMDITKILKKGLKEKKCIKEKRVINKKIYQ